jgi:hypothetical protein
MMCRPIELISYSNVNADIRSAETFSPEETVLFGGDRDFILISRMFLEIVGLILQYITTGIQEMLIQCLIVE